MKFHSDIMSRCWSYWAAVGLGAPGVLFGGAQRARSLWIQFFKIISMQFSRKNVQTNKRLVTTSSVDLVQKQ